VLGSAWLLTAALTLQAPTATPVGASAPATSIAPAPSTAPSAGPAPTRAPVLEAQQPPDAQTAVPPRERPLHDLFRNVVRDLRHLGSTDTLMVAGAGTAAALGLHPGDDNLNGWLMARGPAGYVDAGNLIGDGWVQAGAALGTYATGLLVDHPRATHVGSDLIRAQFLNAILTRGMKLAARRDRPSGSPDSMPSGHTSATFATAAVLHEHFGWKAGAAGYAAAGFVGWSRVRDDHHWLTDIVVGTTIGLIAGRTVTAGHRDRQWAVVPVATHASAAVYVVKR
jgi:membrane-associated phospholipid phosphatase